MPKQVKLARGREFAFKAGKAGRESKYDWDAWLKGDLLQIEQSVGEKDEDGNVVEVTEKKDYEVRTEAMPGKLRSAARRRYKVVQVSRLDADGHPLKNALIIQARDMTPDERTAEDLRRAEVKSRRAGKDDEEETEE